MKYSITSKNSDFKHWPAVTLENDFARLVLIPEIGGKIVSLQSVVTGREFLWQDESRPYRQPHYGDDYGTYDASGFDECFPSIGACLYPAFPWEANQIPDHGELWCIPWQCQVQEAEIYLHTYGVRFPYHFEKWISLAPDCGRYTIKYRITNFSPFAFAYLWSAHPLFAAHEGMRIIIPGEPEMRLSFAVGERVASNFLDTYRWPWLSAPSGEAVDYSLIGSAALAANDKVYATAPQAGWCALYTKTTGDFIAITFPPEKIPFVGVCIDHGGWPFDGAKGYWVALEPCTGWPDGLDVAIAQHKQATLPGHAQVDWSLTLQLGQVESADEIGSLVTPGRVGHNNNGQGA